MPTGIPAAPGAPGVARRRRGFGDRRRDRLRPQWVVGLATLGFWLLGWAAAPAHAAAVDLPPPSTDPGPAAAASTTAGQPAPVVTLPTLSSANAVPATDVMTPASAAHATPPIELTIWGMDWEGQLLASLTARFEAENPDIRVRVLAVPWWAGHEKLVVAIVGGMTPDLAHVGNTWMAEFVAMNALEPLEEHWPAEPSAASRLDQGDTRPGAGGAGNRGAIGTEAASPTTTSSAAGPRIDDYFPGTLETVRFGGRWYAVPFYVDIRILFYRTDLLAAAGFPNAPETWAETRLAARRIKQAHPECRPIALDDVDPLNFFGHFWQFGGTIGSGPGTELLHPQETVATVLAWLEDWRREGLTQHGLSPSVYPVQGLASGQYAMFLGQVSAIKSLREEHPALDGRWATARQPRALVATSFLGGSHLAMFRSCRHPKAAARLLAWLTRPENQEEWYRLTRGLPANRRAWDRPLLRGDPMLQPAREELEQARSPMPMPEFDLLGYQIYRTLEETRAGQHSPAVAAQVLSQRIGAVMARANLWQPRMSRVLAVIGALLVAMTLLGVWFRRSRRDADAGRSGLLSRSAWWFAAPVLLHLILFRGLPMLATIAASFSNYDMYGVANLDQVMFVGLDNYRTLAEDRVFWLALRNTLWFAGVGVAVNLLLSLTLALALHQVADRWRSVLRVGFFLPVVSTLVAVTIVWRWLYTSPAAPLNRLATLLFGEVPLWLDDPKWALAALLAVTVWKNLGYNLVILLVARHGIAGELYEAAAIDGASEWQQCRHITLPAMRRIIGFTAIITGIGYLQCFTEPYLMTGGGPVDSTMTLVLYLYHQGFRFFRVGYAATIANSLFVCTLLLYAARTLLRRQLQFEVTR